MLTKKLTEANRAANINIHAEAKKPMLGRRRFMACVAGLFAAAGTAVPMGFHKRKSFADFHPEMVEQLNAAIAFLTTYEASQNAA